MALASLDQHHPFAYKSHTGGMGFNDLVLETSLLDKDQAAEARSFADDLATINSHGRVMMNTCSISSLDGKRDVVWCYLQDDDLRIGGQFLKQRESVKGLLRELKCAEFHRLDCDSQAIVMTGDELSDFMFWVDLSLEIADQSTYGEPLSALFYQSLSTALYHSWKFFRDDAHIDALRNQYNKTLVPWIETLSLSEHCCHAFKNFYAAQSEKSRLELSVLLRQAVMNLSAFNILACSSAFAFDTNALPPVIVSKMNRRLQQNLLILKKSSGGRLLLEVATCVAAVVSQGISGADGQAKSSRLPERVKQQFGSALDSGKPRGGFDGISFREFDHLTDSLIPHCKAVEEMMDQMTFNSYGVVHNEHLVLERHPQVLQGVVTSCNRLTERIQHAWTQQQLFIRSVSHELMTPLALISATAHHLGDRLKDVPDADLQLMHLLENEACKADRLVRDLTDLSLCESGRLNLSLEPIPAFDVLQEMFGQLALLPWGSRVQHDQLQDLDQLKDVSLLIHPERLIQCLINVFENAAKYSPSASPIHLSQGSFSRGFFFAIKDHGPGISIEDQTNIFKPFFRGMQHSQSVPGSGVGLALVAQLVDLMNGRVAVAESSALGTVVRLEFPVVR